MAEYPVLRHSRERRNRMAATTAACQYQVLDQGAGQGVTAQKTLERAGAAAACAVQLVAVTLKKGYVRT